MNRYLFNIRNDRRPGEQFYGWIAFACLHFVEPWYSGGPRYVTRPQYIRTLGMDGVAE